MSIGIFDDVTAGPHYFRKLAASYSAKLFSSSNDEVRLRKKTGLLRKKQDFRQSIHKRGSPLGSHLCVTSEHLPLYYPTINSRLRELLLWCKRAEFSQKLSPVSQNYLEVIIYIYIGFHKILTCIGYSVVPGLGKIHNKFRIIRKKICRILESIGSVVSQKKIVFFGTQFFELRIKSLKIFFKRMRGLSVKTINE